MSGEHGAASARHFDGGDRLATERRLQRLPAAAALGIAGLALFATGAHAYSAAGDRIFPGTLILPQIAPSDQFYARTSTIPLGSGPGGTNTRDSAVGAVYQKMITERLGAAVEMQYDRIDRGGLSSLSGWQNIEARLQYLAILDAPNEFLLSVGLAHEFASGATRIGASAQGATTPAVFFGQGLGGIGVDFLRPFAIKGYAGFQIADEGPRADRWLTGISVEYSIPYLESKVKALGLPEALARMAPQVELFVTTPADRTRGNPTTALLAPGFNYAGEGWELGAAALVPVTHASGSGPGAIFQLHLALDYLLAESFGRPFFSDR
jgi:hypothetical protein